MKLVLESILFLVSFGFVLLWQNTPLSQYPIPTLVLLGLLYLLVSLQKKKEAGFTIDAYTSRSILVLNTFLLIFVLATGGFASPLFFLLYFISFGIAFAFRPMTVFVSLFGIITIFLPLALKDDVMRNFLMLGSLILLAPVAIIFSRRGTNN